MSNRVIATRPGRGSYLLADVLENFQGRHRNCGDFRGPCLKSWNRRLASHEAFSKDSANCSAPISQEYSFEALGAVQSQNVRTPTSRRAGKGGLRFILSLERSARVTILTEFSRGTSRRRGSLTVIQLPARFQPAVKWRAQARRATRSR